MPEYQCYPLWLYDSDGTLIDNIIPESLQANKELMDALTSVQQQFDALYTNAPQFFKSRFLSTTRNVLNSDRNVVFRLQ